MPRPLFSSLYGWPINHWVIFDWCSTYQVSGHCLSSDGIRINAQAPGWIASPLTKGLREDSSCSDDILKRTPMNRWGETHTLCGTR